MNGETNCNFCINIKQVPRGYIRCNQFIFVPSKNGHIRPSKITREGRTCKRTDTTSHRDASSHLKKVHFFLNGKHLENYHAKPSQLLLTIAALYFSFVIIMIKCAKNYPVSIPFTMKFWARGKSSLKSWKGLISFQQEEKQYWDNAKSKLYIATFLERCWTKALHRW